MDTRTIKTRIFKIIQPATKGDIASAICDWSIVVLISINVVIVVLDTFKDIPAMIRSIFAAIEIFSLIVFSVEYMLRLYTADLLYPKIGKMKALLKYAFSFMAIVDLLAILPFYLPFIFPFDLKILRMFRLMRLLRLLKVNRYNKALSTIGTVIKLKSAQLISSMLVVFILMVISSVLMYNLECDVQPDAFQNALSGLWWTVMTLTTVGYGDVYPITVGGKVLGIFISLLGIGMMAVPIGIISAGFIETVDGNERNNTPKFYCPYCGKKLE
jgi:voltage-gated potassium channel